MSVTVIRDRFVLPSDLFKDMPGKAVMREIGLLARETIVRRTAQGIDATGAAFVPYSEGYAKRKHDELGTSDVNLTVSGRMLGDLTVVDVQETSVTLGFRS